MTDRTDRSEVQLHASANERAERRLTQQRQDTRVAGLRRLHVEHGHPNQDTEAALTRWLDRVDPEHT